MSNEQRTLTVLITRTSQRINTTNEWAALNPTLLAGEIGVDSDTLQLKVGDGEHSWSDLPYLVNGNDSYSAVSGISINGTTISATLLYDELT